MYSVTNTNRIIYSIFMQLCFLKVQLSVRVYIGGYEWVHTLFDGAVEDENTELIIDDFGHDFGRTRRESINDRLDKYRGVINQSDVKQWREDHYYAPTAGHEPYWKGGDWVLLDLDNLRVKPGTPTQPTTATMRKAPTYCGKECPAIFVEFPSKVCAVKITNNQYQTFDNMCRFLQIKCSLEGSKGKFGWWRFTKADLTWQFVQHGPCPKHNEIYLTINHTKVVSRVPVHMKFLQDRFVSQKFNFTPMPFGRTRYFFRFPF